MLLVTSSNVSLYQFCQGEMNSTMIGSNFRQDLEEVTNSFVIKIMSLFFTTKSKGGDQLLKFSVPFEMHY